MLNEKDYCDYETCVALKELGITDCSLQYYEKGCPNTLHRNLLQPLTIRTAEALGRVLAISLYNAQKWLREEKKINISPVYLFTDWGCIIKTPKYGDLIESHSSYEEALLEGVKAAVNILKEERK